MNLSSFLELKCGDVITLTGAGGKTTAMYLLAEELKSSPVLIATTTKISADLPDTVERIVDAKDGTHSSQVPGCTLAAEKVQDEYKYKGVDENVLEKLAGLYTYTIIEADGSKKMPLKGYRKNEPIIPPFANVNIAVITTRGMGKKLTETEILRRERFMEMTGAAGDETLSAKLAANWVCHREGMLKGAKGRKILFINQVESAKEKENAKKIADELIRENRCDLSMIISGSLKEQEYEMIWRRQ